MSDRTFKPVIQENGTILAGGMKIATVTETDLVFDDRFLRRRQARGTESVPVSLSDLVDALIDHLGGLDRI